MESNTADVEADIRATSVSLSLTPGIDAMVTGAHSDPLARCSIEEETHNHRGYRKRSSIL